MIVMQQQTAGRTTRDRTQTMALEEATMPPAGHAAQAPSETTGAAATREARALPRSDATRATLLSGPILPTLLKLALPTMVVLVAQTAVNIAEAYYVGFLGTDAGRKQDADALVFHALVLAVFVGALFTLGTILGGPALYRALGGKADALDAALKYSNYLFAGAIPVWIVNLQAAALRGSGNVRVPAAVTLIGALVMIPTSPILIFGFGPVPRLGIAGAGIAFGLYYCAAMLFLTRYMASGRAGLTFRFAPLRCQLFADILKVGIPTAVNTVLTNLTVILVTGAVGLFGTTALAAYGIASRLDYVMIPILFGLCTATLTMVGVNFGAGEFVRARRIAWTSAFVGLALTGTIGLIVALYPPLWLTLFSHDADVLREGTTYLRIVAPAYAVLGFGFVIAFAAQGAGHVLWPFI